MKMKQQMLEILLMQMGQQLCLGLLDLVSVLSLAVAVLAITPPLSLLRTIFAVFPTAKSGKANESQIMKQQMLEMLLKQMSKKLCLALFDLVSVLSLAVAVLAITPPLSLLRMIFVLNFEHERSEDGFVFPNGARMAIFKGDLAETMADVIVNSTGTHMSLSSGKIAATLLKKAGNELQRECDKLKPIKDGQVVVTNGFRLPCFKVLHVCCPSWGGESTKRALRKIIGDCLVQAGTQQAKSIAFPVLGTGLLDYPRDVTARCFVQASADFAESSPNSSVKKIFVVVFPNDKLTIDEFESALGIKIDYQIQEADNEDPTDIKNITDLPLTWRDPFNKFKEFPVEKDSDEWKQAESNFRRTIGLHKVEILEVRRVQNLKAYHRYEVMKGNVARELSRKEEEVEVYPVWHGTAEANIRKIARGKFDRGLSGAVGGNLLGAGVYFSTTSSYSCRDMFSPPNAAGEKFMIQARMVCGDYCEGNGTMKQTPFKLGSDFKQYDSVVDNVANPTMYAVFDDNAAYPEYIVRYKVIKDTTEDQGESCLLQ